MFFSLNYGGRAAWVPAKRLELLTPPSVAVCSSTELRGHVVVFEGVFSCFVKIVLKTDLSCGRGERIRTSDFLVPNQAL